MQPTHKAVWNQLRGRGIRVVEETHSDHGSVKGEKDGVVHQVV